MESSAEINKDTVGTSTVWNPGNPVIKAAIYLDALPSYDEFFKVIFLKNQLCVLSAKCTIDWPSRRLWVNPDGTPNFYFLQKNFGTSTAPITRCNVENDEASSSTKTKMTVFDFIEYWKNYRAEGYPPNQECLYLKDWHFARQFPDFSAYSPPSLLCSDWLNEFWDVRQDETEHDDYRFVYMGPKNSWTPFHSDVLRSYSWSANICGRKKWIFYPPGDENNLRDKFGQLVHDLRDPSLNDPSKYPDANKVFDKGIEVIQEPGEIVFVPSGWHHQVFNLEDTISINHNWINGAGVHLTWGYLSSQMEKVKKEIADCSTMPEFDLQCQKILKADSGMDYVEFYNFVATIAQHRICALEAYYQYCLKQDAMDSSHPVNLCLLAAANAVWKNKHMGKTNLDTDLSTNIVFSIETIKTNRINKHLPHSIISLPSPLPSERLLPQNENIHRTTLASESLSPLSSPMSPMNPPSLTSYSYAPQLDNSTSLIPSLKQLALSSISPTSIEKFESLSSSYTPPQQSFLQALHSFDFHSISNRSGSSSSSPDTSPVPRSSLSSMKTRHLFSSLSSTTTLPRIVKDTDVDDSSSQVSIHPRLIQSMPIKSSSPLVPQQTLTKLSQPVTFEAKVSSPPLPSSTTKSASVVLLPDVPPPSLSSFSGLTYGVTKRSSSLFVFTSLSNHSLPETSSDSDTSLNNDIPQTSRSETTTLPKFTSGILKPSSQLKMTTSTTTAAPETKRMMFQHGHCPHWAHCGPHLASWDLQRIKDLLQTMRELPEWVAVLLHEENSQKLVENEQHLFEDLENCLRQYNSLL